MATPFTIGRPLGASLALLILLPLAVCLYAYQEMDALQRRAQTLHQSAAGRRDAVNQAGDAFDSAARNFKPDAEPGGGHRRRFADALDGLGRAADAYQRHGAPSDEEARQLAALRQGAANWRGDAPAKSARAIGAAIAALRQSSAQSGARADAAMADAGVRVPQLMICAMIAIATLSIGCALLILGSIMWRLRQAVRVARIATAVNLDQGKDELESLRQALEYMNNCLGPDARAGGAAQPGTAYGIRHQH